MGIDYEELRRTREALVNLKRELKVLATEFDDRLANKEQCKEQVALYDQHLKAAKQAKIVSLPDYRKAMSERELALERVEASTIKVDIARVLVEDCKNKIFEVEYILRPLEKQAQQYGQVLEFFKR